MSKISNLIDTHKATGTPEAFAAIVEYTSRPAVTEYSRKLAAEYFASVFEAPAPAPTPAPESDVEPDPTETLAEAMKVATRALLEEKVQELCGPNGEGYVRIMRSRRYHDLKREAQDEVEAAVQELAGA